jgi:hypothetical protein
MKKILSLTLCAAGALAANAAIGVSNVDLDHAVIYPGLVEIDINGDGILDLIYSGDVRESTAGRMVEDAEGNETQLARNTYQAVWNQETGKYDISEFPYYFGTRPQFAVWDFNGDGLTDFVVASETSMADYSEIGMYLNNGDGTFRKQAMTIVDENEEVLSRWEPRNIDVADFNSDGLMDLVCIGWHNDADGNAQNYNQVLLNQGDFKFKAILTDLICSTGDPYQFALSTVVATDLNNDGYADFLCMGNVDNEDARPVKNGNSIGRSFNAFLNLGTETGEDTVLYDLGLAESVAHLYGHGSIHVADFNNDGTPDIIVGGETPNDGRADGSYEFLWQYLPGRITSDGVSYTDASSSQVFYDKDIRPLNDVCGTRVLDYNGNGQYDLFIPGWCTTMLDGNASTQAGYYFANNNGTFSTYEHIPGASELAVFFLENGVSGNRNYGFVGQSWDDMFFSDATYNGRMMVTTVNPYTKAARPDAPTSLNAEVEESDVTLSWSAAASSQANVTYDYYIRNANTGKYYTGVTAFVGGDKDGIRTTLAQGRAFMNKKLTLVGLPDGTYEWGVQTVNAGLEGSKFANGKFTVGEGGEDTGVSMVNANATVVATEYYDFLGRKLSAAPQNGIVIKKEILSNGTSKANKVAF